MALKKYELCSCPWQSCDKLHGQEIAKFSVRTGTHLQRIGFPS